MRTRTLGTTAFVGLLATLLLGLLLGLLAGCAEQVDDPDPRSPRQADGQPQVRVFALLDRSALRPTQLRDQVRELTGASTLAGLLPPKAFPDDQLPELPALPDGARRFAATTSGCQQQDPPSIRRVGQGWRLRFEDNGTRCLVPDHYVVVWDVGG